MVQWLTLSIGQQKGLIESLCVILFSCCNHTTGTAGNYMRVVAESWLNLGYIVVSPVKDQPHAPPSCLAPEH